MNTIITKYTYNKVTESPIWIDIVWLIILELGIAIFIIFILKKRVKK